LHRKSNFSVLIYESSNSKGEKMKMTKMKLLSSVLLVLVVLFAQVGTAAAAPQTQEGTVSISGTVTEIGQPVTDENGVTTVLVTIETAEGPVIVRVSDIVAAGLTVRGEVQDLVVNSEDVVPPEEEPAEDVHPISALLGEFFEVDASVVNSFHTGDNEAEQVFGFGVIAQALWMATNSEGDTATTDLAVAGAILEAKKSGDYSEVAALLGLDPDDAPTNWGQFKKTLKDKHENLGAAHHPDDDDAANDQNNGNGKNNENKKPKKPKGNGKP
jgi:hypothetical protein